jgi:hypothetical protein
MHIQLPTVAEFIIVCVGNSGAALIEITGNASEW